MENFPITKQHAVDIWQHEVWSDGPGKRLPNKETCSAWLGSREPGCLAVLATGAKLYKGSNKRYFIASYTHDDRDATPYIDTTFPLPTAEASAIAINLA